VEKHLGPVEDAIHQHFIPALLEVEVEEVSEEFRQLLLNGVKQGGMSVRNPTKGVARLHKSLSEASEVLVKSLMEGAVLDLVLHKQCVRKADAKARKERCEEEEASVKVGWVFQLSTRSAVRREVWWVNDMMTPETKLEAWPPWP